MYQVQGNPYAALQSIGMNNMPLPPLGGSLGLGGMPSTSAIYGNNIGSVPIDPTMTDTFPRDARGSGMPVGNVLQGLLGGSPMPSAGGGRQVLPMPPSGAMPQGISMGQMLAGLKGQDRRMMKDYFRGMPDNMRRPLPVPPSEGQVNILPFPFPNAGMPQGGQKPGMQFMGGNPRVLPRGM